MLEEKVKQVTELLEGLRWLSEADYPWTVQILPEFVSDSDQIQPIEFAQFFAIATEIKSWHGEREKEEVERYQRLVDWLKQNASEIAVYRQGEIEVEITVVGKIDHQWLVLRTIAVET